MSGPGGVPTPRAILRGHRSQIHAAAFIHGNARLLTGDADGFVITWDLGTMRPRAVWKAHESSILGLAGWDGDKVITYVHDMLGGTRSVSIPSSCLDNIIAGTGC
jgi:WD40 repeat protein